MQPSDTMELPARRRVQVAAQADRLPISVAVPVVVALSLLCWAAVWAAARLVF